MVANPIILSYVQAEPLLDARSKELTSATTSPDLGRTSVTVTLAEKGIIFPGGERLDWSSIEKICKSEVNCYRVEDNEIQPVQTFSEYTNRMCSLLPTKGAPSMLIAGFVMHRIKDTDPMQDTRS